MRRIQTLVYESGPFPGFTFSLRKRDGNKVRSGFVDHARITLRSGASCTPKPVSCSRPCGRFLLRSMLTSEARYERPGYYVHLDTPNAHIPFIK